MAKKDTFLLVSLHEQQAKELAQVITNNTCRSILDFLSERPEATESQVAQALNVPISTVHYNLDLLVKAKLVDADEFHYSEKGKEVLHYKLASKYIIIAPKSTYGIKEKLKSILPVALVTACTAGIISLLSKTTLYASGIATESFAVAQKAVVAPAMMDAVANNAESEFMAQNAIDTLSYSATQPSIWQSPISWFIVGAVFAIILYFVIDYLRYRQSQRN